MKILAEMKTLLACVILIVFIPKMALSGCNPHEDCKKLSLGTNVANPLDRHSYFKCVQNVNGERIPSDVAIQCPDGQMFSTTSYNRRCVSRGSTGDACINICDGECNNYHYERVADIKDCSSFYTCTPDHGKIKTKCPFDAPYFDGVNCQKNKYVCCSCCDECSAYCKKANTQIADPYDCRKFYICLNTGVAKEDNRYQCLDGQYFNKSKGVCEDEDKLSPCTPSCKNETESKNEYIVSH